MLLEKELKIQSEEELKRFSEDFLSKNGYNLNNVKSEEQINDFYDIVLPSVINDYFSNLKDKEKYDVLFIKSGIELQENWMNAIGSMIKKRGKILIKKMA
ncbi:MAG: hypothetical protein AB6733_12470 [Clostridiaceae bacterium]